MTFVFQRRRAGSLAAPDFPGQGGGVALVLGLGLALLAGGSTLRAQETALPEYQLKAAFIFNFAKFVEWPPEAFPEPRSPIVIGILGENPFGDSMEQMIRDKTVNGRPLVIREFHSPAEATNCHVLFVSNSEKKRLQEVFRSLQGASVLTVGEADHFTETGGMIGFVPAGNKIRFQINDEAAKRAGLKISSKLLNLAVRPAP